jgi:arylsulfatase A-like enzyme
MKFLCFFLPLALFSDVRAEKYNVLFIAVDDMNDYISPLDNHPGIKTPNFDRLAKRSVTFANAHCAAPACHPSRVAMMTGVHPTTSGIYRNMFGAHGPRWRHEAPVLEHAVVLSQHFRDHGYRSVGGGKIFHTLQWTPHDSQNDPSAWDDYRGDPLDPISKDWPRPKLTPDSAAGLQPGRPLGKSQLFGATPLHVPDEKTGDHMVVDWAIDQMNAKQHKPLFLAVGLFRPHIPWEVPQKWFDLYPMAGVKLPAHLKDDLQDAHSHGREHWHKWVVQNKQWSRFMRGYLASISYVDHQLGRLLDALDKSPLAGKTIIVLWSDHGFHIGEKENWEKFALWDQTTRVPLFLHAPGISKDGAKTRQAVTLTDVYPTLCELNGLPTPKQCDGASLLPQLKGPTSNHGRLSLTSFQFWNEKAPSHAVSDLRYRYIKYGNGFEELYDLQDDPNEFSNLAGDPAFARIQQRLALGIPKRVADICKMPKSSPYSRSVWLQQERSNESNNGRQGGE